MSDSQFSFSFKFAFVSREQRQSCKKAKEKKTSEFLAQNFSSKGALFTTKARMRLGSCPKASPKIHRCTGWKKKEFSFLPLESRDPQLSGPPNHYLYLHFIAQPSESSSSSSSSSLHHHCIITASSLHFTAF